MMWYLKALISSLAFLTPAIAKGFTDGKFEAYHLKSTSSGPLQLNDKTYEDVTAAPRNYTAAILLTALEARFGCQLCRDFQPEWDLIAKSWSRADTSGQHRVLYGTLDFIDGKATFQKVTYPLLIFSTSEIVC